MMDPEVGLGLAHFLEHMLFMGSGKYNRVDEFAECISKYQGNSNAYTSLRRTVYFFNLAEAGLKTCLDIFANFFINPLFQEDTVHKEVNAVNSEFQNYLTNQLWA